MVSVSMVSVSVIVRFRLNVLATAREWVIAKF